jgi:hypothetical protein
MSDLFSYWHAQPQTDISRPTRIWLDPIGKYRRRRSSLARGVADLTGPASQQLLKKRDRADIDINSDRIGRNLSSGHVAILRLEPSWSLGLPNQHPLVK